MLYILILSALILALGGWLVFLHIKFRKLLRANKALLKQAKGSNLEEILNSQNKNITKLRDDVSKLKLSLNSLEKKLGFAVKNLNLVRYDAFAEKGGEQSYSIAFLDQHQNGLVISNLHTREGDRLYAKLVSEGHSDKYLTKEELEAINQDQEENGDHGGKS